MLKVSSHDDTYAVHILILSYFSHYPSHAVLVIRYGGPRHVRLITVQRCMSRTDPTRSQIQNPSELKKEVHQVPGVRVYQSLSLLGTSQHLPASPGISQHLPPSSQLPPEGTCLALWVSWCFSQKTIQKGLFLEPGQPVTPGFHPRKWWGREAHFFSQIFVGKMFLFPHLQISFFSSFFEKCP